MQENNTTILQRLDENETRMGQLDEHIQSRTAETVPTRKRALQEPLRAGKRHRRIPLSLQVNIFH